jgi:hypothetical protein
MKTSVVSAPAYIAAHGLPVPRGGSEDPEVRALWAKLSKLEPIKMPHGSNGNGGGQFIVIEPEKDEDDLRLIKSRTYSALRGYMKRAVPRTFAFRLQLRRDEHHVLLWKEALPVQAPQAHAPATAELAEQPTGPEQKREAVARPRLAPRGRDGREKTRNEPGPQPHLTTDIAAPRPAPSR